MRHEIAPRDLSDDDDVGGIDPSAADVSAVDPAPFDPTAPDPTALDPTPHDVAPGGLDRGATPPDEQFAPRRPLLPRDIAALRRFDEDGPVEEPGRTRVSRRATVRPAPARRAADAPPPALAAPGPQGAAAESPVPEVEEPLAEAERIPAAAHSADGEGPNAGRARSDRVQADRAQIDRAAVDRATVDRDQVDASWDPSSPALSEALSAAAERPGGPVARLSGWRALAAAATVLFAPAAIYALVITGAPTWTLAPPALAALPLTVLAGAALIRPLAPVWFAAAQLPIILAAGWLAWASGGALSPAAPWALAALAALIAFGGARAVFWSALGAGAAVAAVASIAPPPDAFLIGYAPRADREAAAFVSWIGAGVALAGVIWAAHAAWIAALPALRHPTIAARQSLGALAQEAGVAAIRLGPDAAVREVVGASDAAFGMPPEELAGVDFTLLAHPDDQQALASLLRGAPPRGGAAAETEPRDALDGLEAKARASGGEIAHLRLRSRFGGFRWVEAALAPAEAYAPAIGGLGRRRRADAAEERVLVLRARRRRTDAARSDPDRAGLLAHVHDGLRRELSAVVGYSDMLKNEIFGPLGADRYREYARLAHDGGSHLLELVDELLELAAVDAGRVGADPALIDPIPVIEGAARLAKRRAERRGVALEVDAPPSTPHLRTDRRALRRVLINLFVDTARRCSVGDGVVLRVETEPDAISFKFYVRREGVGQASAADAATDVASRKATGVAVDKATGDALPAARPARSEGGDASGARAGADAEDGAEDDAEGVTELGEARLGRLVAISLAERLGGGLLFTDGEAAFDRLPERADQAARLVIEAIFPIGSASLRATESAASSPATPFASIAAGSAARPRSAAAPSRAPSRAPAAPPAPRAGGARPGGPNGASGVVAPSPAGWSAPDGDDKAQEAFELVVDAEIVLDAGFEEAATEVALLDAQRGRRAESAPTSGDDDAEQGPLFGTAPPSDGSKPAR